MLLKHIIYHDIPCRFAETQEVKRMNKNRTMTTMVSESEADIIDEYVDAGIYCSRSDAIRIFIRHCIFVMESEGIVIR